MTYTTQSLGRGLSGSGEVVVTAKQVGVLDAALVDHEARTVVLEAAVADLLARVIVLETP